MKIQTAIIFLLLTACTPSLYYVTTETDFQDINTQLNQRKLIYLHPDMADEDKLDSIATAINKKKWKRLAKKTIAMKTEDRRFLRSVKHLIDKEYLSSYRHLDSLDNHAYDCQVQLLKTDCLRELRVDSVNFKSRYQDALDCTRSEIIKSIINTRYRFLRYDQ